MFVIKMTLSPRDVVLSIICSYNVLEYWGGDKEIKWVLIKYVTAKILIRNFTVKIFEILKRSSFEDKFQAVFISYNEKL